MELISVNHSLNQTYQVDILAVEQAVKRAISRLRNFKLVESEVFTSSNCKEVNIKVSIDFPGNITIKEGTIKVKTEIENLVSNLLDVNPKNIEIKVNR